MGEMDCQGKSVEKNLMGQKFYYMEKICSISPNSFHPENEIRSLLSFQK